MSSHLHSDGTETDAVQRRVLGVIATVRNLPIDSVRPEKTFAELDIDSLGCLDVVFELEGEFDIVIPNEGAYAMQSVHDAIVGVQQLLEEKAVASA
jgi:acyl carrier protein